MTIPELVDEIKTIYVESEFNAHMAIIECHHQVGKLILAHKGEGDITNFLKSLAPMVGKSERTLWYAVKFAEKFPELDSSLPEGKNLNWNTIIMKHLTDSPTARPAVEQQHTHLPQLICKTCRVILKENA